MLRPPSRPSHSSEHHAAPSASLSSICGTRTPMPSRLALPSTFCGSTCAWRTSHVVLAAVMSLRRCPKKDLHLTCPSAQPSCSSSAPRLAWQVRRAARRCRPWHACSCGLVGWVEQVLGRRLPCVCGMRSAVGVGVGGRQAANQRRWRWKVMLEWCWWYLRSASPQTSESPWAASVSTCSLDVRYITSGSCVGPRRAHFHCSDLVRCCHLCRSVVMKGGVLLMG